MRKAGRTSATLVYDLTAKRTLFALRPGAMLPPASVEKLYTSVALLHELSPNLHLQTAVLGTGHLGRRGTWHGNLYLRGGGDPTFGDELFNRTWELGYGPTATDLASQLVAAGIRRVSGRVIGDASLFDALPGGPASGYQPDIGDFGGQLSALTYDHGSTIGKLTAPAFAVRELVLTMRTRHIKARAAVAPGVTPTNARTLATVTSPPLSVLVRLMDVPSDDLFAELLTKQLGARLLGQGSIVAGARVIANAVADYGVHPQIVDGSGLSRSDRTSPNEVVALLRRVWHTPVGHILSASLPVVGVNGTVRGLALHTPAQGHCIAKTGTLNNVTNLAGYCAARGHHVLTFATFIDGPQNAQAEKLLGSMVAAIARY
jgi:D-alanyl-D-alanine carboxypeptidase/D-alanyl-D-alanine-endopeptidase (penicillin-binding protein 4)